MPNYKLWNNRRRHEWLATKLPKKRVKRRSARRVGLLDAWARRGQLPAAPAESSEAQEA